ncbi:PhzF family phenazine biosynthesis protein [uncultured Shewanella sp.]|uniref:PhzF family phenazine biosynthesis protein n=1 Tax=uncultured Shewanella sp. TaxID=173975 RepID=UPI002619A9BC|nr:PhzF family phenazine biosynthesis protein [uncultured Shewanella sp.]
MELDIFVVDAFTDKQFGGNSAAVVPVEDWLAVDLMQSIASENNLSETAFIKRVDLNHYQIRWFSPITEIDFCGHATLAAAHVLFNQFSCVGEVCFSTDKVGDLKVTQVSNADSTATPSAIEMSFPNLKPEIVESVPNALTAGLSVTPKAVLKNQQAYFAVMDSAADVINLEYQSELLALLAPLDVVVTAQADATSEYDFISRYFWPANGGDEDPVTGSIHAGLAPYWSEQLNKTDLVAFQASTRGGKLCCRISDDRVFVSGCGKLYLKGRIYV